MTTPAAADLKPARLRLWSNWLWILAGILGMAVLWSAGRLIHDQRIRREALQSLARDKATEIANLAVTRFNLLSAEAFGPAFGPARGDVVTSLEEAQKERVACKCRETLPIARFFRAERRDDVAQTVVDVSGNDAIITVASPAGAYGAAVPVAGLAGVLFGSIPLVLPASTSGAPSNSIFVHGSLAALHAKHMAEHRRLVQLDTLGLGVVADSTAVFGTVADRPYAATATLPPPLERFHVNVSMMGSQVAMPLVMPFAHDRLWLNGVLILITIVVCLFAIGASRREVALARARSDFVAGVSHDLRMPLAQILLASETLSLGRDRNEKERASLTGSILREGRRLKAMIDNVLLFSRSGAVGIQPNLQAVDVQPLLRSVTESVDLAVADAGQTIETSDRTSGRVVADRALLHQALVNLVDNAIKYGPRGQVIRLAARTEVNIVSLVVADEGPGIPRAARDRLFEPYERLARDATSERTGSGLGLAVVRQIVMACRGTVRIDDADRGTRIVIELPAAP